jgi:hypothetical protein
VANLEDFSLVTKWQNSTPPQKDTASGCLYIYLQTYILELTYWTLLSSVFFLSEFSLLIDTKTLGNFGETVFSSVISTNFANFEAKFAKISTLVIWRQKKTLLLRLHALGTNAETSAENQCESKSSTCWWMKAKTDWGCVNEYQWLGQTTLMIRSCMCTRELVQSFVLDGQHIILASEQKPPPSDYLWKWPG